MSGAETDFAGIAQVLRGARRVVVASHVRPDGDAYGSTLAMLLHLQSRGLQVMGWNADGMTQKFRYLPHAELIVTPPAQPVEADVLLALDTSTEERLGSVRGAVRAPVVVNIDHHVSNHRYGDLNLVDPSAPATGQILFDYLVADGAEITPAIAANLFAAISTDTGSFQYDKTSPHTLRVAAQLVEAGVDVPELSRQMYDSHPRRRLELLKSLLNTARFLCQDRVAAFSLSRAAAEQLGALPEDNEGLIDHLRAVEGVMAAAFFEELPDGKVRASLRSKDPRVDVCRVCGLFGGGGHPMAAGARLPGPLAAAEEQVLQALCDEVRNND